MAIKHVSPTTARKGKFIKSFEMNEKTQMLNYAAGVAKAMKRHRIPGEVVYTVVTSSWGGQSYQIFVVR